ncbi:MAG: zinc metalloprotease HtpX [Alphaproteobacteria bacterium]|nr:zinc metalloprotease HtpX [Alphaproteobacteria bacterium]
MGRTKTVLLMCGLMLIFMYVGNLIGGEQGMKTAFWVACGMNFFSYFFSDKIVLKQYHAIPANEKSAPELYQIVKRLSDKAGLPMPKVYIIPEQVPNAFATGRNPSHAAVAATEGLLQLMSPEEVEGVLAHEMSHVRHYDILIGSIAAVFAGAITMLARVAPYSSAAAGNGYNDNNRSNRSKLGVLGAFLMPIAASIIQMTISRTREYAADEGAARLTGHPEWLMSALSKLEGYSKNYQMQHMTSQTAHMFIVNPFGSLTGGLASLFRTHPSTADRIARLEKIRRGQL